MTLRVINSQFAKIEPEFSKGTIYFPSWVEITKCKTVTFSNIRMTPHGVVREETRVSTAIVRPMAEIKRMNTFNAVQR